MSWAFKWGRDLESGFYYNLLLKGRLTEEDIEPPTYEFFSHYVDAFHELNTCRNNMSGISPIPFTAIKEYFSMYGGEDSFDDFLYLIREMDNRLIFLEDKKRKEKK